MGLSHVNLQSVWGAEEAFREAPCRCLGCQEGSSRQVPEVFRMALSLPGELKVFDTEGFWKKTDLFSPLNMTCQVGPRTEDNRGRRTPRMVQLTNLPSEGVEWIFKALTRRHGIKGVKDPVI